ncbi:sodium:proton antiporter [Planctomicrobium sp. SH668]|uniref:sodium:proton antiporter n=1 Tax=Planctomicrobium sp. SH668 TaxID=3448126 RepID=UPI003F5B41EB
MSSAEHSPRADRLCFAAMVLLIVLYAGASLLGWPQAATAIISGHREHASDIAVNDQDPQSEHAGSEDDHEHPKAAKPTPPSVFAVIPFVILLGSIAILPLLRQTEHWWESNLHRFYVAAGLGVLTICYYLFFHAHPVENHFVHHGLVHPSESGPNWQVGATVLKNALLAEYIPFIVLLFSLYTICGGIRISGDLPAHPLTNTIFLFIGGALASFIGTTGAAMILIRPLLETNAERKNVAHTVVFFIFIVCNCGGCLLPIGDPPLFLGYLQGIPFLWTLSLWKEWAFINCSLLVIYYLWDHFYAYPRESFRDFMKDETELRPLSFSGMGLNLPLLAGVVLAVALLDPSKPVPGTNWHAWLWLREAIQLALVAISLGLGAKHIRQNNKFNFTAIIEVAALFVGIFLCMQPALQILDVHGASLGLDSAPKFFWITGGLSAVLDNAPTYLVFFKTAQALALEGTSIAGVEVNLLTAISLGAVMMGAMSYIGNGPNFMVKSIAEKSGVKMPSFFGYMLYSCAVLLPLLAVMQWLFVH